MAHYLELLGFKAGEFKYIEFTPGTLKTDETTINVPKYLKENPLNGQYIFFIGSILKNQRDITKEVNQTEMPYTLSAS